MAGRKSEDRKHIRLLNLAAAKGHKLIQHGLRVTHSSVRPDRHRHQEGVRAEAQLPRQPHADRGDDQHAANVQPGDQVINGGQHDGGLSQSHLQKESR